MSLTTLRRPRPSCAHNVALPRMVRQQAPPLAPSPCTRQKVRVLRGLHQAAQSVADPLQVEPPLARPEEPSLRTCGALTAAGSTVPLALTPQERQQLAAFLRYPIEVLDPQIEQVGDPGEGRLD